MKVTTTNLIIIAVLAIVSSSLSFPIHNGDYTEKPDYDLDLIFMELALTPDFEDENITGVISYTFSPKNPFVDTLIWSASEMMITSVTSSGPEAKFRQQKDSLVISFDNYLNARAQVKLTLEYKATPAFGVHRTQTGTMLSSRLPGAGSHWMPGPVHPIIETPFHAVITVPDTHTALFSGEHQSVEEKNGNRTYVYSSEKPVALSELAFVVGELGSEEIYSGTKRLRLYYEDNGEDRQTHLDLLSFVSTSIRELERKARNELPVTDFSVVLLNDDFWETKVFAHGMAFVNTSASYKKEHIWHALLAQWFGVTLRPRTWNDHRAFAFLHAIVANEMGMSMPKRDREELAVAFELPETAYDNYSIASITYADMALGDDQHRDFSNILAESVKDLHHIKKSWTHRNFQSYLYNQSGRWLSIPDVTDDGIGKTSRYQLTFEEHSEDTISVILTPLSNPKTAQTELSISWESEGELHERIVTMNPEGDTLFLSNQATTRYILGNSLSSNIELVEKKSFSFWLQQLRNHQAGEKREQAALALMTFSSEPDLQLAVQDMLSREDAPRVLASLYNVLAEITDGARGTERRFIDGSNSPHSEIRLVSMRALKSYRGIEHVEQHVLSTIQMSNDLALVNEAIRTYRHLLDADEFRRFVIRFLREDRENLHFTETLLEELFNIPVTSRSINAATHYLSSSLPYTFRWSAYKLLKNYSEELEWQREFVDNHVKDPDPRIRYLVVSSISVLDDEEKESFIEQRLLKEYDQRIIEQLHRMAISL